MSHNSLSYNDELLAGPSTNSTPLSFDLPKIPYKIDVPIHRQSLSHAQPNESCMPQRPRSHSIDTEERQFLILSQFQIPGEEEAMKTMIHLPNRFPSDAYGGYHHISTFLMGSPSSSNAEDFDADLAEIPSVHPTMQHNHSSGLFRHDASAIQSPLYHQQDLPLNSYHNFTPQELSKSLESPCMKLRESADLLASDAHGRSQTLSPYAPMPLQPIFHLVPQSKILHDPIDPALQPSQHTDDAMSLPIDPLLTSCPHAGLEEASDAALVSFARGSITSRSLWPPSSFVSEFPMPMHQDLCLPVDIPLEIAKQYARDWRAASPYSQLSQQFLLSFMGQSVGKLPWLCYIQGCGKQLTRKSHMIDHIRMHLDERVYACEYCPQTFLRKADCKRHTAAHNPEKAFQCDLCIKSFGRKDLLTRHKRKCETNSNQTEVSSARARKRKGSQLHGHGSSLNSQGTSNLTLGDLFPDHLENYENDGRSLVFDSDGTNKENIPSFLLPSDFISTPTVTEGRPRKKARTLF